ncbi:MAG: DUF4127 family protein [Selenomonadaceae bacterium]|nr:DUF4127 family protein [Selenomonadaceae bacterium]
MILIMLANFSKAEAEKILFVPHDDRPISCQQTAEVIRQAGYEILMPPKELLGLKGADKHPDKLWRWLEKNAPSANAAVISADSLLYGGLIPSRKHEFPSKIIAARVENFKTLREKNPSLRLYVFASLMRTPYTGTKGDIEEPEYYAEHGANIHNYTALVDKSEISGLTDAERTQLKYCRDSIPSEILNNWLGRRAKNFTATKKLIDMTYDGIIDYLVVGRDDNSALSQTHMENRKLLVRAERDDLTKNKFQSLAGIDEFNLLLLTRAVNDMRGDTPKIFVGYNTGAGGGMVPFFSSEPIENSIADAAAITGSQLVDSPSRADFILLVNTDPNGATLWAHNRKPDGTKMVPNYTPNAGTKFFADMVERYVAQGYAVGVADINYCNGSDNALMKILHDENLLYKLKSYSGWNTATNSTGFALATGILAIHMDSDAKDRLLTRRYLDDWAYQANIRTIVGCQLDPVHYYQFDGERAWVESEETRLMREFAQKNLPPFDYLSGLKVSNPWNRMFECEITFSD